MVKEKNEPSLIEFLKQEMSESEREIIDTRWYVYEYTPPYNTGGYYDTDIPAKSVQVSDYFPTLKEAQQWLDRHEPDNGNTLKIGKQNKRRKVLIGWYDY